jgi:hypothetical protein
MLEKENLENQEDINAPVQQKVFFPEDHRYLTFLKKIFRHEFRK